MKIIHFVRHFHPRLGGVEKHVYNVIQEQMRQGLEVDVITWQYENMLCYENYKGINIYRSPALRSPLRNCLWHLKYLHKYITSDVLHFHNLDSFEYIPFLVFLKSKIVLTLHGWGGKFPIPEKDKIRVKTVSERYASRIITVGHFVNKWYGIKSDAVIYGAVDDQLFTENKSAKIYDICVFGRLESDAGITLYKDALEELIKLTGGKIKICIVGDGSMKESLLKSLVGAEINYVGFVKNTQQYLEQSKICFTSGYLGILECLAAQTKVCSVYDNQLKEDYLRLSPYADYIYITNNKDELIKQVLYNLSNDDESLPPVPNPIKDLNWSNLIEVYRKEYAQVLLDRTSKLKT